MSTQKDHLRCLEQLAATPPKRAVALIRSLLPGIERALRSGQDLKGIWEALQTKGLQVSYHARSTWSYGGPEESQPLTGAGENKPNLLR